LSFRRPRSSLELPTPSLEGADEREILVSWLDEYRSDPAEAGPYRLFRREVERYYHKYLPIFDWPPRRGGRI
jgi:hypothetical protein